MDSKASVNARVSHVFSWPSIEAVKRWTVDPVSALREKTFHTKHMSSRRPRVSRLLKNQERSTENTNRHEKRPLIRVISFASWIVFFFLGTDTSFFSTLLDLDVCRTASGSERMPRAMLIHKSSGTLRCAKLSVRIRSLPLAVLQ